MENYYDERSDGWRDGDAGSNYSDWKSQWEEFSADEIDAAEMIEPPEVSHADDFDALENEVSM